MSEKVELIAAAFVNAVGGDVPVIEFKSNYGFKTASRASDGLYTLTLDDKHDINHLDIQVTRKSGVPGSIQADVLSKDTIQIANYDTVTGLAADVPFYVNVYRVRSHD